MTNTNLKEATIWNSCRDIFFVKTNMICSLQRLKSIFLKELKYYDTFL